MVSKAVIGVTSLICVIGVVIGVVAVVGTSHKKQNLSASQRTVSALCGGAMYKDSCETTLTKAAKNDSASTSDIIKDAAKAALEDIIKNFNLTDVLKKKADDQKKSDGVKMAVNDCSELFQDSIEKLQSAIDKIGDTNGYKDQGKMFDLRLWISDSLTYLDNCMDGLEGTNDTEFRDDLNSGLKNATMITMSVLDAFTYFIKALNEIGFDLDTDKITQALKGDEGEKAKGRRLLGFDGPTEMLDGGGVPRWLSEGDRELLSLEGKGRSLAGPPPTVTVAKDGSGQFKTITEAIAAYNPKKGAPPVKHVIYVKAGVYEEQVLIGRKQGNIFMYGDGPTKTIVTGKKFYIKDKLTTSQTHSFAVLGSNFVCRDMGFENTAGPTGHQAVALRADGENQVFLNCAFNAYQDTLYAQSGSQFFRDCTVSGTVDFIFGNGATILQHCTIIVRVPLPTQYNAVTAQGRTGKSMPTGIVLQDCTIQGEPGLAKTVRTYLGRPWKEYARTVFLQNEIADIIQPQGFVDWDMPPGPFKATAFYGEFGNRGPGAATAARLKWPNNNIRVLSPQEANAFTPTQFLPNGEAWIKPSGAPFFLGMKA
ncbi:hypothetical protein V2J09_020141 [Rumex salicifolius]